MTIIHHVAPSVAIAPAWAQLSQRGAAQQKQCGAPLAAGQGRVAGYQVAFKASFRERRKTALNQLG